MGPQRKDWTFPKKGAVLIEALEAKRERLITLIDTGVTNQQHRERELEEYREKLRVAGIEGWAHAKMPDDYTRRTMYTSQENKPYTGYAKELIEVDMYLAALRIDITRDPHREFKLLADDLRWFEFD